mmetsp:Transcript_14218/g.32251  ORF Transcript_14218/g.32251 Transcript_14218/m.32251 type:complete len:326 (-) Transcript_14218:173-1150(-)
MIRRRQHWAAALAALYGVFAQASRTVGTRSDRTALAFLDEVSSTFRHWRHSAAHRFRGPPQRGNGSAPLLTIGMLTSPEIAHWANASAANWREYASLHGYRMEVVTGGTKEACGQELWKRLQKASGSFAPIWGKVCLLQRMLRENVKVHGDDAGNGYVLVIDADTFIQRPDFSMVDELVHGVLASNSEAKGMMFDDRSHRTDYPGCWNSNNGAHGVCRPNSFFMLFRRCKDSQAFARLWLDDALGLCSDSAGSFPPTQNVLWHCTLPQTLLKNKGFLHVHNGMDRFYTMDINDKHFPFVHFHDQKSDIKTTRLAISRATHVLHAG